MNESFEQTVKFALVVAATMFYLGVSGWFIVKEDTSFVVSVVGAVFSYVLFAVLAHLYIIKTENTQASQSDVAHAHYYNPRLLEKKIQFVLGVFYSFVIVARHVPILTWFGFSAHPLDQPIWIIVFGLPFAVVVAVVWFGLLKRHHWMRTT